MAQRVLYVRVVEADDGHFLQKRRNGGFSKVGKKGLKPAKL
jgi:hypothetical protein